MMKHIYGILLLLAPVAFGDTNSNAYGSGSGGATNGQVQLGYQAISSMASDIPQAISQSQNTASGTSISLYGSTNTGLNLDPVDAVTRPTYYASNGANSNGNAITGILQNNDQSHSNTSGQQHFSIGQSQTTGNGTGVSISNSGSSSLNRAEYTTRAPYTTCGGYCGYPCYMTSYCYCQCPYYTSTYYPDYTSYPPSSTASPLVKTEAGRQRKVATHADNRHRKPVQQAGSKQRKTSAQDRTRGKTEERKVQAAPFRTHGKPQGKLSQQRGATGKAVVRQRA